MVSARLDYADLLCRNIQRHYASNAFGMDAAGFAIFHAMARLEATKAGFHMTGRMLLHDAIESPERADPVWDLVDF